MKLQSTALALTLSGILAGCRQEAPPTIVPTGPPPFLAPILDFTDSLEPFPGRKSSEVVASDDFLRELKEQVAQNPSNFRARMLLAQFYQELMDYRHAIEELEAAVRLDPALAEPHYQLGDIYYDLALLDMIARRLYEQDPQGFLLFAPDDTTRQIFTNAITEFETFERLEKTLTFDAPDGARIVFANPQKAEQRLQQASIYLSGAREEAIFTEDQAKAVTWLMQTGEHAQNDTQHKAGDILAYFSRMTDNGHEPVPDAIPLVQPQRGKGKLLDWVGVAYQSEIRLIYLSGRADRESLRAAADLAWNVWGWTFAVAVSNEKMAGEAQSLVRVSGPAILEKATKIGLDLDADSRRILRAESVSREEHQHVLEQIDRSLNKLGGESAILNVYAITSSRLSLLYLFSSVPPEGWPEVWPHLVQWRKLDFYALNAGFPDSRREELRKIETSLQTAASAKDHKTIDAELGRFHTWCDALFQHILTTFES